MTFWESFITYGQEVIPCHWQNCFVQLVGQPQPLENINWNKPKIFNSNQRIESLYLSYLGIGFLISLDRISILKVPCLPHLYSEGVWEPQWRGNYNLGNYQITNLRYQPNTCNFLDETNNNSRFSFDQIFKNIWDFVFEQIFIKCLTNI